MRWLSRKLHDWRGTCGYERSTDPDAVQGRFWCKHCKAWRLERPRIKWSTLENWIQ